MRPRLTFGYAHDFRNPPQFHIPSTEYFGQIIDFYTHIEGLGFDAAWLPEHHLSDDGYIPSPVVMLAALAARTSKLRLGTSVALAPLYHPVRFAEDCAVADIISGGRLEIGIGLGWRRAEVEAYGGNFKTRASQTDEFLEIVRRLWAGEKFSYQGRHFDLKNVSVRPSPVRGHIPLWVGGYGDKALDRAVKYGDGYVGSIELCDPFLKKWAAAGKDPAAARMQALFLFMVVADDPDKARAELAPYFHHVNNAYGRWFQEEEEYSRMKMPSSPVPMSLDEFNKSGILHIKTPAEAIGYFNGVLAQAPVEHFKLAVPPGIPPHKFIPYAELFAKRVMPAFS